MKLKEAQVEHDGMNKELYDLFIEMITFEYNKASFLKGAKFYCWAHGLQNYTNFFKCMMDTCAKCKNDFIYYILNQFEEVPEIKINAIKTDFESAEEVFTEFVKMEESFVEILEKLVKKAKEIDDVAAMAFSLPILQKIDHIACRALEAVKNDKDPYALVRRYCEDDLPY